MLQTKELVADWVASVRRQVERYLDFEGPSGAEMVNNLDWTSPLSAIDFLRDVGKHYRIGTMLKKDAVSARLNSDAGISYTEFSYQILQGYDFLELYRSRGCVLQTGGSDQWGNLTSGIDLIRRAEGVAVHAIGTPLITDSDGRKFSKSEGTAVWLDPEQTSPYAFFQFWLNTSDADVIGRLKVFTFLSRAEIEDLGTSAAERPGLREAQRRLAWEATALVHGDAAADAARDASAALFGSGELEGIDEGTLASACGRAAPRDRRRRRPARRAAGRDRPREVERRTPGGRSRRAAPTSTTASSTTRRLVLGEGGPAPRPLRGALQARQADPGGGHLRLTSIPGVTPDPRKQRGSGATTRPSVSCKLRTGDVTRNVSSCQRDAADEDRVTSTPDSPPTA